MSLYPVIVVGVLALVSVATLIGAAQGVGGPCTHRDADDRQFPADGWAEQAGAERVRAMERASAAAERAGQCLPPRSRRCPWCGCPIPPNH